MQKDHQITLLPHFRRIRYYGVLANGANKELLPMVFAALNQEQQLISFENWREREIAFTGIDSLACPICYKPMKLVEIVYFLKEQDTSGGYTP